MPKINYFLNSYDYFTKLNQGPLNGLVLDYGSNYGRFLESSDGQFDQKNYVGIDVDKDALNDGKIMFPNAEFIHYNKHNFWYNPKGQKDIWPEVNKEFEYIISYSVITHTTKEDMVEAITWLYSKLKTGGKMFVSYLDIENKVALDFFSKKRTKDFGSCDKIVTTDYAYLVDNKASKIPSEGMFLAFYSKSFLIQLLKDFNCKLVKSPDQFGGCFQDCIIIQK